MRFTPAERAERANARRADRHPERRIEGYELDTIVHVERMFDFRSRTPVISVAPRNPRDIVDAALT